MNSIHKYAVVTGLIATLSLSAMPGGRFRSLAHKGQKQRPLTPLNEQQASRYKKILKTANDIATSLQNAITDQEVYSAFDDLEQIQETIDTILNSESVRDYRQSPSQLARDLIRQDLTPLFEAKKIIRDAGNPDDYIIDEDAYIPAVSPTELDAPERWVRHHRTSSFGKLTKEVQQFRAHRPIARRNSTH